MEPPNNDIPGNGCENDKSYVYWTHPPLKTQNTSLLLDVSATYKGLNQVYTISADKNW